MQAPRQTGRTRVGCCMQRKGWGGEEERTGKEEEEEEFIRIRERHSVGERHGGNFLNGERSRLWVPVSAW